MLRSIFVASGIDDNIIILIVFWRMRGVWLWDNFHGKKDLVNYVPFVLGLKYLSLLWHSNFYLQGRWYPYRCRGFWMLLFFSLKILYRRWCLLEHFKCFSAYIFSYFIMLSVGFLYSCNDIINLYEVWCKGKISSSFKHRVFLQ